MKIRLGFVSNSSSSSFMIHNRSDKVKTLRDFIEENPQLVEEYNQMYDEGYSQLDLIGSVDWYDYLWKPNEILECTFGDEHDNPIGQVFDYILRDGGTSENFRWNFLRFNR
jgi:hypothetical protein